MRAISLINHLEFDFSGSVVRKGVALGDVDNDGCHELIVGNENGEVAIFKGLERWHTLTNLGFVSCVIVGDILNQNRNCLVIVTADGWCYIYDSELQSSDTADERNVENTEEGVEQVDGQAFSGVSIGTPKSDSLTEESKGPEKCSHLKKIHAQRIPPNSKDILLGDIDGDGLIEMVLGLTDRVVRSYRWVENCKDSTLADDTSTTDETSDCHLDSHPGKLVALNKWECAKQIGSISLHHSPDGTPTLLVAQPGGTFMRIRHDETSSVQPPEILEQSDSSSSPSENLTGFSVDYQFLGISRMRNQNISTEILGDFKTAAARLNSSLDSNNKIDIAVKGSPSEKVAKNTGVPYAVATLDGTIMLVQDEIILWSIAVDHQVFALTKLDVTGNGIDEIVVCSWDGHTYILDQQKNIIRFQLNESVQAFNSGYYTLIYGSVPVTCFVYVTFRNKILLYFDIPLKNMVCKKFEPDLSTLPDVFAAESDEGKFSKKQLVEYLLYGVKLD